LERSVDPVTRGAGGEEAGLEGCLDESEASGANLTLDTGPEPPRLLRFARNDTAKGCHCEEWSDEAISTQDSMTGIIRMVPSTSAT
jgi:hypothetical protein